MVAIPPEMMAIDHDDDDGGRAAIAELAAELGELPADPGAPHPARRAPDLPDPARLGRPGVGRQGPRQPGPRRVDLRMPGQILMAHPSVVPGPDGQARYGPVTGDRRRRAPRRLPDRLDPAPARPRPPAAGADPARQRPTGPPGTSTTP